MTDASVKSGRERLAEPDNVRGAIWMFGASMCFATSVIMIKYAGVRLPSVEMGFVRNFLGLIVIFPMIVRGGWGVFRTASPMMNIIRILCSTFSVVLSIYAVTHLNVAMAVALGFTRPLFMIVLAKLVLHEHVHWRRGLATVVGFIGVIIVIGPSDMSSLPGALAALAGAAALAGTMVVVRQQSATDGPITIMVWASTGICLTTGVPAFLVWQAPTLIEWIMLLMFGVTATLGQFLMIKAFTYGEATAVNPVDYSQIIVTSIVGYFLFAEVPTIWTVVGTFIIIGSTLYIILREAKLKRAMALAEVQAAAQAET